MLMGLAALLVAASCAQPMATAGFGRVGAATDQPGSITVELPPPAELLPYSLASLLTDAKLSWSRIRSGAGVAGDGRALACLTQAIYYEARSEGRDGKLAVAQVVINRVGRRGFGRTVCDVVDQATPGGGCQFSFRCNGSLRMPRDRMAWRSAEYIAESALAGTISTAIGSATFYHNNTVLPEWAHRFKRVTRIGAHIFYSANA
jgi:hypothetical protein